MVAPKHVFIAGLVLAASVMGYQALTDDVSQIVGQKADSLPQEVPSIELDDIASAVQLDIEQDQIKSAELQEASTAPEAKPLMPIEELQQLYVEAESMQDVEKRVPLWQKIIKKLEGRSLDGVIDTAFVRKNLINDLMESDINAVFEEAQHVQDDEARAWVWVALMRKQMQVGQESVFYAASDAFERDILHVEDAEKRSYLVAAFLQNWLEAEHLLHEAYGKLKRYVWHVASESHRAVLLKNALPLVRDDKLLAAKQDNQVLETLARARIEANLFWDGLWTAVAISDDKQQAKLLRDFVELFLEQGNDVRAYYTALLLGDPGNAVRAWGDVAVFYGKRDYGGRASDARDKALYYLNKVKGQDNMQSANLRLAKQMAMAGFGDDAATLLDRVDERSERWVNAAYELAKLHIEHGNEDAYLDIVDKIPSGFDDKIAQLDERWSAAQNQQAEQNKFSAEVSAIIERLEAGEEARTLIPDIAKLPQTKERRALFRQAAEHYAASLDVYHMLEGRVEAQVWRQSTESGLLKLETPTQQQTIQSSAKQEQKLRVSTVGDVLPNLAFPDRLKLSGDELVRQRPVLELPHVEAVPAGMMDYDDKFYGSIGQQNLVRSQSSIVPEVLFLASGVTTVSGLYDALSAKGLGHYLERDGEHFMLKAPLIIGKKAAFIVDDSTASLRMSQQDYAYIANAGGLYVLGGSVVGWDSSSAKPAYAVYKQQYDFRPFIVSWSGSQTVLANSEFVALGYSSGKSYGIAISDGPVEVLNGGQFRPSRPSATIVDNYFDNLLYGFYSYDADDVALVGNEYNNNITYAIDPHDRSKRLTIAYNTTYNSQEKHGIIISREVGDTEIVGNVSFANAGAGFMLDRMSNENLIYANHAFANAQDGMTLFESSCNLIAANNFSYNGWFGVRVRNSLNIGIFANHIAHNERSAIGGYTLALEEDESHESRDFGLDPYIKASSYTAVANHIENNETGLFAEDMAATTLKQNSFLHQSPKLIRGAWFESNPDVAFQKQTQGGGVVLMRQCVQADIPHEPSCRYRSAGYFAGDGQVNLTTRLQSQPCQPQE